MVGDVLWVAAIFVSLLALVNSYIVSARSQGAATLSTSTQLTLEVDKVFIDHPDIRPYFYENLPCPTRGSANHNLVLATGEFLLDSLECIWDHNINNKNQIDRRAWESYIRDVYASCPVARDLYKKYEGDIPEEDGWYPALRKLNFTIEPETSSL